MMVTVFYDSLAFRMFDVRSSAGQSRWLGQDVQEHDDP